MNYKFTAGQLKKFIRNVILTEAKALKPEQGTSLDSQVDQYLIDYETEAKRVKNEGYSLRAITMRLLSEDEDDPEESNDKVLSLDDIDIESFANDLVRLIDNYDSLLEVRNTITKRAKDFLGKNYNQDVIDSFEEVLKEQHGIVIDKSEYEVKNSDYQAPPADRAGPMSGGGGA